MSIYVMAFHKPELYRADIDVQGMRDLGQEAQYDHIAFIIAELPDASGAKEHMTDAVILQAWSDGYVLDYDYTSQLVRVYATIFDIASFRHLMEAIDQWHDWLAHGLVKGHVNAKTR
jgi:hypothetical protein